jgi:hypothetical protein
LPKQRLENAGASHRRKTARAIRFPDGEHDSLLVEQAAVEFRRRQEWIAIGLCAAADGRKRTAKLSGRRTLRRSGTFSLSAHRAGIVGSQTGDGTARSRHFYSACAPSLWNAGDNRAELLLP